MPWLETRTQRPQIRHRSQRRDLTQRNAAQKRDFAVAPQRRGWAALSVLATGLSSQRAIRRNGAKGSRYFDACWPQAVIS